MVLAICKGESEYQSQRNEKLALQSARDEEWEIPIGNLIPRLQRYVRGSAQLDLKQENEELRRQLTDMTTKFNQCQTKLSTLENSTVSAERYHTIMMAQQELSQQTISAAKSQKVTLDSMQQEISALNEGKASLRHSYEELEQSHKAAQVEYESQIKELHQQLTSRSRSIIALEDESRMMMRHQRADVRECRINRRNGQETENACGSNRTSVKAWRSSALKKRI
jgi:chromosome segregation ATPase